MGPLIIYQVIKLIKELKNLLFSVNKVCICGLRRLTPNPSLPVMQFWPEAFCLNSFQTCSTTYPDLRTAKDTLQ